MAPKPLLIISDAPSSTTGLGRITRDLATRLHAHCSDVFRVGTLGYGGPGSRSLPFQQYNIHSIENWHIPELQGVWDDFAGEERGIVLTIWDPSRLRWLTQPEGVDWKGLPICPPHLRLFLKDRPFELWGYIPVDAAGVNGKLTAVIKHALEGYDRILAYSEWGAGIIDNTIKWGTPALPHGIDTSVFRPHPRTAAKAKFRQMGFDNLSDDSFLVGIVATNQARKDYGLGMEVCSRLLQQGLDVRVWIHTDAMIRAWNMMALIEDFGLLGRVVVTIEPYTDEEMSLLYSACDVTLGIGLGEGYGYPIFESLACGTPVVHGDYGGAAEHLNSAMKAVAHEWRFEGQFNCLRPVFDASHWTQSVQYVVDKATLHDSYLPPDLDWNNLWPRWEAWFRGGLKCSQ